MSKLLLDSNIIIGLAKNRFPVEIIQNNKPIVSDITRLEVFGYHQLTNREAIVLNDFFGNITCLTISKELIDKAIELRRQKRMFVLLTH